MRIGPTLVVVVVVTCSGCGDDDGGMTPPGTDGGVDTDGAVGGTGPEAPADPMPPVLGPCPDGWRELTSESGVTTCDPMPETGTADCTGAEAHFPGTPGCAEIGTPCGAGDFADGLPTDRNVVYVREGATGGDGSMGTPFGRIADGLGAARAGDVVALARGTYDEEVFVRPGVTLWGACAAETTLTTSAATAMYVVRAGGADSELRNLRIGDTNARGLWVSRAEAVVRVEGVLVESVREVGVSVIGMLTGRDLVVRDTQGRLPDFSRGWGVDVEIGGSLDLDRLVVERARGQGMLAAMRGSITLRDSLIRNTQSATDLSGGRGLVVQTEGTASLERTLVEGNRDIGIVVGFEGSTVDADQLVVRQTRENVAAREFGDGLTSILGGALVVRRVVLEENTGSAVTANMAGIATLEDVVAVRTQSIPDGTAGRGFTALMGSRLEATRAVLEENRQAAAAAQQAGTEMILTDFVARRTMEEPGTGLNGRGIDIELGATAEVTRALLEDNRLMHVHVSSGASSITLTDVVARRSELGRGVNLEHEGVSAVVTRAVFEDLVDHGIFAGGDGVTATLTDVVIRDLSGAFGGRFGRAINVQDGATISVDSASIERAREVSVVAFNGGSLNASNLVIREALEAECATTSCADNPAGSAVGAFGDGAAVSLSGFTITGAPLCGLHLARGGEIDATDGVVESTRIGACLQTDGFDPARVSTTVGYRDNEVNIEATSLPVPEVGGAAP